MSKDKHLIGHFLRQHPKDALKVISGFSSEQIAELIVDLDEKNQRIIFGGLTIRKAAKVMANLPTGHSLSLFEELPFQNSVAILRSLDFQLRNSILEQLPSEEATRLRRALYFQKKQVGSHIDARAPYLLEDKNIQECVSYMKGEEAEAHQHVFVVNHERMLIGCVAVTELLTADMTQSITSVMRLAPEPISSEMSIKEALNNWDETFYELPVTSTEGQFIGTICRQHLKISVKSKKTFDNAAMKASSALAEVYLVGLTSLLGISIHE